MTKGKGSRHRWETPGERRDKKDAGRKGRGKRREGRENRGKEREVRRGYTPEPVCGQRCGSPHLTPGHTGRGGLLEP